MTIGNCDCCDRKNVPGSVVDVPGEPFACYICQGDPLPDPYCELEDVLPPAAIMAQFDAAITAVRGWVEGERS